MSRVVEGGKPTSAMKWYHVLEGNAVKNPMVMGSADLKGWDEWWHYARGNKIDRWDETAWFKVEQRSDDGEPDDVLQEHIGIPVYSSRLRSALDKANITGIQYLPVRVIHYDSTEIKGYAIANILNLVPAIDFERSVRSKHYDVFPEDYFLPDRRGNVQWIFNPILAGSALEGYDIIRLKEFKPPVFVSERFKDVFTKGGFTGYLFDEVQLSS